MPLKTALGVTALSIALLLAGCSSGSTPSPSATSAPASSAAQPTQSAQKSQPTAAAAPTTAPTAVAKQSTAAPAATTAPAAGQAKIDPCVLVTKSDAEAALGEPVDAPGTKEQKLAKEGVMNQCQYMAASGKASSYITVQVTTRAETASKSWTLDTHWQNLEKGYGDAGAKIEPVDGIGEKASWVLNPVGPTGPKQGILQFRKKDAIVAIWVPTANPSALDNAKKMATAAAARY